MNITFISDTHTCHRQIQMPMSGDVICHCGDMTNFGSSRVVKDFAEWFDELDFDYKIFIAGNHDLSAETKKDKFLKKIPEDIIYLENEGVVINGIKFWGSPVSPHTIQAWAFAKERGEEIRAYWDMIPEDTDVLLTHGPPYGVGDETSTPQEGEDPHRGCKDLLEVVQNVKPFIHSFGHIHEGRTVYDDKRNNIAYINASVVNKAREVVNDPIKVFLNKDDEEIYLIDK